MMQTVQRSATISSLTPDLSEIHALLSSVLAETDIDAGIREGLAFALDEVLSSITAYARYKGAASELRVTIDVNDVRFKATIVDSLNAFDLAVAMSDSEMQASLARERSHSMGVFMLRHVVDEINYTYRKGFQNELELIKFL